MSLILVPRQRLDEEGLLMWFRVNPDWQIIIAP